MKLLFIILLFISSFSIAHAQRAANKEAIVILVAGQSNANGSGSALANITNFIDYESQSCKVWNGTSFDNLTAKTTNNNQFPAYSINGNFSFAVPLVANLYDSTSQNIYLIPYAIGGTKMYDDGGNCWTATRTNTFYNEFITEAIQGIAVVAAANDRYTVKMVYCQGETDCTNQTWANAYETNLSGLIDSVRNDLGIADLQIFIPRIHASSHSSYVYLSTVRTAQANVVAAKTNCHLMNVDDLALNIDLQHLTSASHITLAARISALIPKKKLLIFNY